MSSGGFASSYAAVKVLFYGILLDASGLQLDEEAKRRKARKANEERRRERAA